VSRRASLPGAEELFRRTTPDKAADRAPATERTPGDQQHAKSTKLQVATEDERGPDGAPPKAPKHAEKVTFYCTAEDLVSLERARLKLRSEHGVAADRGRIVRASLSYVLEDFDARGDDSILLRKLAD
jgi:hypothetical protein